MFPRTARNGWLPVSTSAGLLLIVVASGAAIGCVTVEAGDSGFVLGGSIVVPEGEVARDDVVAVLGDVYINGRARRDVVVIGGRLEINGTVDGSVSCVGGTLVLGPGAHIEGDAVLVGGFLERHATARIDGEFVNVSIGYPGGQLRSFSPGGWGSWWGFTPFAWMFRTTQLFYWLLLALLTVVLVGDRVSSASHAISREPLRLGAIGLVGIFALCFAFFVLLLLSFVIIGIPFLIALFVIWWLAYIFGIVAVFQAVGARVMDLVGRPDASQIAIVLSGALLMGILRYVPFGFGDLVWIAAALVGLGSVFATRFGTGRPWVHRAAAPLPGQAPPPAGDPFSPPPGSQPQPEPEPQPDDFEPQSDSSAGDEPEQPAVDEDERGDDD